MSLLNLDPAAQVALAQIRVALSEIAPEIPETEIVPEASFFADLRLDLVSKWALALELEHLTKSELLDQEINRASRVEDFMRLISDSQVTQSLAQETQSVKVTQENLHQRNSDHPNSDLFVSDLPVETVSSEGNAAPDSQLATAADLAALFDSGLA